MKKIYNFLLGSALVFCTGCSADLLDIPVGGINLS